MGIVIPIDVSKRERLDFLLARNLELSPLIGFSDEKGELDGSILERSIHNEENLFIQKRIEGCMERSYVKEWFRNWKEIRELKLALGDDSTERAIEYLLS